MKKICPWAQALSQLKEKLGSLALALTTYRLKRKGLRVKFI